MHGAILYRLRDIENREIFIPHVCTCNWRPSRGGGGPRRNFVKMFDADKTRIIWLPYAMYMVKKL